MGAGGGLVLAGPAHHQLLLQVPLPTTRGREQHHHQAGSSSSIQGGRHGPRAQEVCVLLGGRRLSRLVPACLPACLSKLIFFMYLAGIVAGGLYSIPPFYFKRFPAVAGR